jgi:hypothetical protein
MVSEGLQRHVSRLVKLDLSSAANLLSECTELGPGQSFGEHVSHVGSSGDPVELDAFFLGLLFEEVESCFHMLEPGGELLLVPCTECSLFVTINGECRGHGTCGRELQFFSTTFLLGLQR